MIRQKAMHRTSRRVDNGTMGFHDYETIHENMEDFLARVSKEANTILENNLVLSISYPSPSLAIIVYQEIQN